MSETIPLFSKSGPTAQNVQMEGKFWDEGSTPIRAKTF